VRDTELYRRLLGLEPPWKVARVELDVKQRRVDVYAEHGKRKTWPCPECDAPCGLHDHDEERTWRHLDSCQFETHLHARLPRVRCDEHGVRQVRVPWAEPKSRFTLLFESFAIDVLWETDVLGAARILGISWDEAHGIMERAVERGLARREHKVPEYVGLDEKALARGQRYATISCDLSDGHVIEIAPERTMESVVRCFQAFSLDELTGVRAVAMDMWEPFIRIVSAMLPAANDKIVFDRFHIVKHINDAVDIVRRRENRALRAEGDDRLVGSKHMWLYAAENLPERYAVDFSSLRKANLKTARAWAIKETLRELWDQPSRSQGEAWYKRWHFWATHSRLAPVKRVAAMIRRHLPGVLSYFTHRITNSASEALNSTIQMIKKRAFGFRSFENFRTAVLFRCGGLQLHPCTSHPKP
jgi:transposase